MLGGRILDCLSFILTKLLSGLLHYVDTPLPHFQTPLHVVSHVFLSTIHHGVIRSVQQIVRDGARDHEWLTATSTTTSTPTPTWTSSRWWWWSGTNSLQQLRVHALVMPFVVQCLHFHLLLGDGPRSSVTGVQQRQRIQTAHCEPPPARFLAKTGRKGHPHPPGTGCDLRSVCAIQGRGPEPGLHPRRIPDCRRPPPVIRIRRSDVVGLLCRVARLKPGHLGKHFHQGQKERHLVAARIAMLERRTVAHRADDPVLRWLALVPSHHVV
jgi:hypothetical protein